MVRYIISMAYYSDEDSTLYTEIDDDVYLNFSAAKAAMDSLARIQADNLSVEFVQSNAPTNARIDAANGEFFVYQIHRLEIEDDKEMYKVGKKKLQEMASEILSEGEGLAHTQIVCENPSSLTFNFPIVEDGESVHARTFVSDIEDGFDYKKIGQETIIKAIEWTDKGLQFSVDSADKEDTEFINFLSRYCSKVYWQCLETGARYFASNDAEGKYFPEKYYAQAYGGYALFKEYHDANQFLTDDVATYHNDITDPEYYIIEVTYK